MKSSWHIIMAGGWCLGALAVANLVGGCAGAALAITIRWTSSILTGITIRDITTTITTGMAATTTKSTVSTMIRTTGINRPETGDHARTLSFMRAASRIGGRR